MPATRARRPSHGGNMTSFEDSLASKPFVFVVGEELKTFHIHKDLIGQLSPALSALVNGRMKEAREGRVEWPDLDVDTFVRFAKYAYSRDYVEADPEMLPHPPPPAPEIAQPQDSQSSQNQMIDLTNQADGGSVGEDTPANDDEQSWSSMDDESSDEAIEDDDVDDDDEEDSDDDDEDEDEDDDIEEEEDDDDDHEGENEGQGGVNPLSFGIEDLGPVHTYIRSPTEFSSTLSSSHGPVPQDFTNLPYSVRGYINSWEGYLRSMLFTDPESSRNSRNAVQRPSKRRLLNSGECRFASSANLKYSAMRRFVKLEMEHPDDLWEPRPNVDPYEKYEPVFMSHVRLYALAEKYGIEKLKTLTLHRMHLALQRFTIFPERVGDVVCIVPIIYDYTVAGDMAREMIVQFFCCVAEHVKVNRDFRFALRSVGEFADDLFQEMTSRLL